MYLMHTTLDICYIVNALSQFMSDLKHIHLVAAKTDLSKLSKENHILQGQLQKFHDDDQNSKGKMEDNIFALNK